ncbi:hypothetical protein L873DRAFT_1849664 [Choiromyces venosus 120613-1]|uniref:Uncharacterized protein n=1 Tax=Choiromyces venosus 120613-1 TaxID=1336337 RepID=A0A3N4IWA5_9PEZI|nr:hypothetical protein L873DRAFT_1849664 [Choiromyces venosus 120613-1]
MPLTNITKLGRISTFRTTQSICFTGLYGKRGLSSSPKVMYKMNTDADPEVESGKEVPINTSLPNRVRMLEQGYTALSSKVDTGFNQINDRFDKIDQKFDRIDAKVDGWVKWGLRVGLGFVGTGILAIWDTKREIHQTQKEMQKFIKESTTESENRLKSKIAESEVRLESKLMLAFVREVHENVKGEVQHAVGIMNANKNGKAQG